MKRTVACSKSYAVNFTRFALPRADDEKRRGGEEGRRGPEEKGRRRKIGGRRRMSARE